jgi:hypothetical protein
MPTIQEEILRLKYETQGEDRVASLSSLLDRQKKEVEELKAAYHGGTLGFDAYISSLRKADRDIKTLEASLTKTRVAVSGNAGFNPAMMSASYAIQDFITAGGGLQQKLAGVSNNIGPLVMALGGPVGLTAVVGAAAAAFTLFATDLQRILQPIGDTEDAVNRLNKEIANLTDDPIAVSVDTSQLSRLKAELKDVENARKKAEEAGGKPSVVGKAGKRVEEALSEFGGYTENMTGQQNVLSTITKVMAGRDPELARIRAEIERLKAYRSSDEFKQVMATPGGANAAASLNAQQSALRKALASRTGVVRNQAGDILGQAMDGDQNAIMDLSKFVGSNMEAFKSSGASSQLLTELKASTPSVIREQEAQAQAARFREEAKQREEGAARKDEEFRKADEMARKRAEAEQRRNDDLQTRAEAQTAGRVGAVVDAGMLTPLETQLSQGQDPFALTQGLAQELQAQGVSQKAAIDQAASMVDRAIQNVMMSNAQKDAAIVNALNNISQSMNIQANQAQRTRAQIFSQQSGTMGNFRGRGR